jgi:predicted enzyme related to lactoylglutathione lyase
MDEISFSIGEIGQVEVQVKDLDRALAYYHGTLGIRILSSDSTAAICDCSGIRLMLKASRSDKNRSVIYFKVDDIFSVYTVLSERGVNFFDPPRVIAEAPEYKLLVSFFNDPDGNLLALMSENIP